MRVSRGALWEAVSFKNCESILSGSVDQDRFFTPSISIFNGGISGTWLYSIRGYSVRFSLVKQMKKWLFRTLAFVLPSIHV